ncbi:MAG: hypothetical protein LUE64_03910 [Candidatus Gastranaerophilales bacterium]|nr:hypothetical protein [Candidatus Gastranaerophilales bacterium]MCD8024658.1 hypothetical protein [Candidatus Gastranaerophilales bacterium]
MAERKIIVKNKRRINEQQELTLTEFKKQYNRELALAFESYKKLCVSKNMVLPPYMQKNTNYETDFYFDLRTNFNLHSNSIWYIDRII